MLKTILLVISALAVARAQLPSFGRCADTVAMTDFDIAKFLGPWYEAEKSYQLTSEITTNCPVAYYSRGSDNKYYVDNIMGIRFFGLLRHIKGEILLPASKADSGKFNLRYNGPWPNLPNQYHVLHTDYKSYAVMWNCNNMGPFHQANVWIMTKSPHPSSEDLQKAYGILDKYKIPTTLVRTDHTDCKYTGIDGLEALTDFPKPEEEIVEEPNKLKLSACANENEKSIGFAESALIKTEEKKEKKLAKPSEIPQIILRTANNEGDEITKESNKKKVKEPVDPVSKVEPVIAAAPPIKLTVDDSNEEQKKKEEKKIKN